MLLRKWTGPPRTSGLSSQIVIDNRPDARVIHNVPTERPLILLVMPTWMPAPTEPHSMRHPNERATAAQRSRRPIHWKAQWHQTPVGIVPS